MGDALTCFITDDRRSVQTLRLLVGADAAGARELALDDLQQEPHHLAIEIRSGDEVVVTVSRADLAADRAPRRAPALG